MFKMLARLYLILIVTYGIALYAVPDIVLKLFDQRTVTYNLEQARGTLKLIQKRFAQAPAADWPRIEQELKADFAPLELRVVPLADASLIEQERAELRQGENVVRLGYYGSLGTALTPLPFDHAVELVAPDPPIDINMIYWLMNLLVGAALLGCLYFWVRPHWKDLQRLQHTAQSLGQGNLRERTHISQGSNIGELAQVFDKMAQAIEGLLSQQQDLLNAVSHELRTPLSRLEFGMALMLADQQAPDTRVRLEQMVEHVRELDTLVDELLSYTRLQSPYLLADVQEVPLQAFLDSVLGGFFEQADSQPIELSLHLEHAPQRLRLDPRLTARALQNLVGNAMRYGIREVRVTALGAADALIIRVEDDGIGIPVEEQERIFEPFYRMDRSRDRQTGGFGLGLAITRRAIQCQGGSVQVAVSSLGGAGFEIRLPARALISE